MEAEEHVRQELLRCVVRSHLVLDESGEMLEAQAGVSQKGKDEP